MNKFPKIFHPIFFAHIMCPHLPFVLDEHGNFKASGDAFRFQPANRDVPQLKSDYLGQLKYVDRKIADAVDGILANSKVRWLAWIRKTGIYGK